MEVKKRKPRATKEQMRLKRVEDAKRILAEKSTAVKNNVVGDPGGNSVIDSEFQPLSLYPVPGKLDEPKDNGGNNEGPQSNVNIDPEKDKRLKEGLAEIVSEDIPRFLGNGLVLMGWDKRAKVNPPSRGRAELWAEFALPMLRKYFPNFDAEMLFWILTASLLTSMIEIKKIDGKEVLKDANTTN